MNDTNRGVALKQARFCGYTALGIIIFDELLPRLGSYAAMKILLNKFVSLLRNKKAELFFSE